MMGTHKMQQDAVSSQQIMKCCIFRLIDSFVSCSKDGSIIINNQTESIKIKENTKTIYTCITYLDENKFALGTFDKGYNNHN